MDTIKKKCPDVKFTSYFAMLWEYDFMNIYAAPDPATATKILMISRQFGASYAESIPANTL